VKPLYLLLGVVFVVIAFFSVDLLAFAGLSVEEGGNWSQVVIYLFTAIGGFFFIRGLFGGR
jgi:hypothetical protein